MLRRSIDERNNGGSVEIHWEKRAFNKLQRTINSLFAATRCPHYRRTSGEPYRYKNVSHIFRLRVECSVDRACRSYFLRADGH